MILIDRSFSGLPPKSKMSGLAANKYYANDTPPTNSQVFGKQETLKKNDAEALASAFDEARRKSYTARRQSGLDALGGASVLHFREADLLREERERYDTALQAQQNAHPLFKTTENTKERRDPIDHATGDTVLQLVVPTGVSGGQRVRIELIAGGVISVKIPKGFEVGDKFKVRVPVSLKTAAEKKNKADRQVAVKAPIENTDQLKVVLPGQQNNMDDSDDDSKKKKKKKKKKEKVRQSVLFVTLGMNHRSTHSFSSFLFLFSFCADNIYLSLCTYDDF